MNRPRRRRRGGMSPVAAGAIGLLLVAIGTYLGFAKRIPFTSPYEIEAVVSSSNSLKPNSEVRIAGVKVGKVTKVDRGPGSTALVTMAIQDSGRPIRKDATLKIRPRTFLEGNFFVDLSPGSSRAPELDDGDQIPLAQTAIPVQLDQVLNTLEAPTRVALKDVLNEYGTALRGGGAQALRRSFPEWAPTFRNTTAAMAALRGTRDDDLSTLIGATARVTTTLSREQRALGDLLTSFRTSVGALASRQQQVSGTLRGLDDTVRAAYPSLGALNAAIPSLRTFTREVRPSLRRLPTTLDLAQPVIDQLAGLIREPELPGLVSDLRPALRSLIRLEPRLVRLTRNVEPVTECVRSNALPVLKDSVRDGAHTTGQPVWQELLKAMPTLASASSNFDGSGNWVRYYAGLSDESLSLGSIPGPTDVLQSLSPDPVLGSRPAPPVKAPPFRPDVPCRGQQRADLDSYRTAPPPRQRSVRLPERVELPAAMRRGVQRTLRGALDSDRRGAAR